MPVTLGIIFGLIKIESLIQMLDHVIMGEPMNGRQGYFSFKEAGTIG